VFCYYYSWVDGDGWDTQSVVAMEIFTAMVAESTDDCIITTMVQGSCL